MAAVGEFPKCFSVQNNMEVLKSDGETMRSLWVYWYVCGGALERVGREEGEEDCRGGEDEYVKGVIHVGDKCVG